MKSKIRKCIVLVLVMVISPAVANADITAGLAGHWKLDEISGPTAYNSAGGNNGTLHNGPVWRPSGGKFDGAISFDEVNDYVTITDFEYTNASDEFSLCFWFKIDDIAGTGLQYIFSHGNVSLKNSLNVYFIESDHIQTDIAGKLRTKLVLNDDSSWYGTTPSAILADGNWHMYAVTLSSVNGTSIYIDGNLVVAEPSLKGAFNPTTSIYLGGRCDLDTSRYYGNSSVDDGLLDDVRIYNRVLSEAEIDAIYNAVTVTEPFHVGMINPGNLTAIASSVTTYGDGTRLPQYAVNGAGLNSDAHDSDMADGKMWNADKAIVNEWFRVDLGNSYELDHMKVWNFNWAGYVDRGVNQADIYFSNAISDPGNPVDDPSNWTLIGTAGSQTFTQASGRSDYGTNAAYSMPDEVNLAGFTANWVAFKVNSNHGSSTTGAVGLSEVQFFAVFRSNYAKIPSPPDNAKNIDKDVILRWTPGVDAVTHDVYFGTDQIAVGDANDSSSEYKGSRNLYDVWYSPSGLESGRTYYWRIDEVNDANDNSPWKGSVWSFTTNRECDFRIRGDFNWDCYIDIEDFAFLSDEWLTSSDSIDLTYDDYVDIEDFVEFAGNWLTCNDTNNPNCDGKAGIDITYPGGNILVDQVVGDTIYVQQDIRDTGGWWFYWNFRLWGAEGRTLSFQFTNGNPIGLRGPAVSTDLGETWSWMGATGGAYFNYTFAEDEEEVRFCFTIPYQESDLVQFLDRHAGNPNLSVEEHCLTRKGRSTRRLFLGKLDAEPTYRVQLTCRHHSCETTASYVFEGILEEILADTDDGQWFRQNVEVLAIPFMDKDGVEEGDQGKNRLPYDHNRDYVGESIYPSVAAIREFAPTWSNGKLRLTLDMHSPTQNETHIYFFVDDRYPFRQNSDEFCQILENEQTGSLVYHTSNNKHSTPLPAMNRGWCSTLSGVLVPITLEFPYATADGNVVTAESARAFGHDIAHAIRLYLQQQP